jgi:hypothetical protein
MKSLEKWERFIAERNTRRQNEGLPRFNISSRRISETMNPKYEIHGTRILTYAPTTPAKRFGIVVVFSTEMGDP